MKGLKKIVREIWQKSSPELDYHHIVYFPTHFLDEVRSLGGSLQAPPMDLFELTGKTIHDTIFVTPDPELGSVLRSNVSATTYQLKSKLSFNFNLPVLVLPTGAQLSEEFQKFLNQQSVCQCSYTTDNEGFRSVVPYVESSEELLVIGDSVPFGYMVDDDDTVCSFLQREIGSDLRVINAGVCGYGAREARIVAERRAAEKTYSGLIYVACTNDFAYAADQKEDPVELAREELGKIAELRARFSDTIHLMFHTYIEYELQDLFVNEGWGKKSLDSVERLREELPGICRELNFSYNDWSDTVSQYASEAGSYYAPLALYVDHCHWSALGNSLAARDISKHVIRQLRSAESDNVSRIGNP